MKRLFNGKICKLLMFVLCALLLSGCSEIVGELYSGPYGESTAIASDTDYMDVAETETATDTAEPQAAEVTEQEAEVPEAPVTEGEFYYDVENVVLYLELYHELPLNYITKKEAEKRGWQGGSVEDYVKDAAIGGDHFGNYEGILPEDDYRECDIDTHNYKNRGSRRLIYTDDGKYYYTKNHYESFYEVCVDENYIVTINRNEELR